MASSLSGQIDDLFQTLDDAIRVQLERLERANTHSTPVQVYASPDLDRVQTELHNWETVLSSVADQVRRAQDDLSQHEVAFRRALAAFNTARGVLQSARSDSSQTGA
jgi:hypothetical protein